MKSRTSFSLMNFIPYVLYFVTSDQICWIKTTKWLCHSNSWNWISVLLFFKLYSGFVSNKMFYLWFLASCILTSLCELELNACTICTVLSLRITLSYLRILWGLIWSALRFLWISVLYVSVVFGILVLLSVLCMHTTYTHEMDQCTMVVFFFVEE